MTSSEGTVRGHSRVHAPWIHAGAGAAEAALVSAGALAARYALRHADIR